MTAVAPPLSLQPNARLGWTPSGGSNGFGPIGTDDNSRMFTPGPRKPIQRQNSATSISSSTSSNSSTSTIAAGPIQTNGGLTPAADAGNWAVRKKPMRGLWPPSKAEPATGITTARPQTINSALSGPPASAAISALHVPAPTPPQMSNPPVQANGFRAPGQADPPAILHLAPMNGTFERKTITVPYFPDVLRIGRQTNQKTLPTPLNGYFDSKVLSRQHAEIYADRNGHIFIRDIKSSNGTFVNGMRLSQENKESEPRELREQDVLELGIDIVSEDQKTVVHHKVAAKVEYAGVYGPVVDSLNFGDLDLGAGGPLAGPHQLKRNGSQGSLSGRSILSSTASQAGPALNLLNQPQHMRNWLNPITTEHIVKKINMEMRLAMQQSEELARARRAIEAMLSSHSSPVQKDRNDSERLVRSPSKSKTDLKSHFSAPPAPPPTAPLPDKPDVARALADPIIQPILRRGDTVQPPPNAISPTRIDHSFDIVRLCEELKIAKGELSHQSERMRSLEHELAQERIARESAEERALSLETDQRRDSPRDSFVNEKSNVTRENNTTPSEPLPDLQAQLDRLHASMDEMKIQMEAFRQRAEAAELDRDEARQTLAEMIEQKRKDNEAANDSSSRARSLSSRPAKKNAKSEKLVPRSDDVSGDVTSTSLVAVNPTGDVLLENAGVEAGQPITREQAKALTQFLTQEILKPPRNSSSSARAYYGIPITSAAAVVILGVILMNWGNGPKVER